MIPKRAVLAFGLLENALALIAIVVGCYYAWDAPLRFFLPAFIVGAVAGLKFGQLLPMVFVEVLKRSGYIPSGVVVAIPAVGESPRAFPTGARPFFMHAECEDRFPSGFSVLDRRESRIEPGQPTPPPCHVCREPMQPFANMVGLLAIPANPRTTPNDPAAEETAAT